MNYRGLKALGLYQSEEEIANSPQVSWNTPRVGDIKYADINGDGKIDSNDRIKISRGIRPEMMFALMADANYKGFDLSVQFQGAALCDKMLQYSWQDLNGATDMTPMTRPWYANWGQRSSLSGRKQLATRSYKCGISSSDCQQCISFKQCPTIGFLERNGAYLRLKNDFRIYASLKPGPTRWIVKHQSLCTDIYRFQVYRSRKYKCSNRILSTTTYIQFLV